MILRTATVLFLFSVGLSAEEPGLTANWHLDGKGLDLHTATLQAAQRALLAKPRLPNDPKLQIWTLQGEDQSRAEALGQSGTGAAACAIPLLPAPRPEKNFATRDYKLPAGSADAPFVHPAMPVCKP